MPARPYLCPACRTPLGALTRWSDRGNVRARIRISRRAVLVEKTRDGTYLHCPCGKRTWLGDRVEVVVR